MLTKEGDIRSRRPQYGKAPTRREKTAQGPELNQTFNHGTIVYSSKSIKYGLL